MVTSAELIHTVLCMNAKDMWPDWKQPGGPVVVQVRDVSNYGWDGGCWIVLDRDCEPISSYHHHSEADAHAISIPLSLYVRRVPCGTEPVDGWHSLPERTETDA